LVRCIENTLPNMDVSGSIACGTTGCNIVVNPNKASSKINLVHSDGMYLLATGAGSKVIERPMLVIQQHRARAQEGILSEPSAILRRATRTRRTRRSAARSRGARALAQNLPGTAQMATEKLIERYIRPEQIKLKRAAGGLYGYRQRVV